MSTEQVWDQDWYRAVVGASTRHGAGVALKSYYKHKASQRVLKRTSDRNALIRACDTGSDRIHIRMGEPDEVIVEQARELGVSMVVLGNSARTGISAAIRGNTAEKVLDQLDCDLLAMP